MLDAMCVWYMYAQVKLELDHFISSRYYLRIFKTVFPYIIIFANAFRCSLRKYILEKGTTRIHFHLVDSCNIQCCIGVDGNKSFLSSVYLSVCLPSQLQVHVLLLILVYFPLLGLNFKNYCLGDLKKPPSSFLFNC